VHLHAGRPSHGGTTTKRIICRGLNGDLPKCERVGRFPETGTRCGFCIWSSSCRQGICMPVKYRQVLGALCAISEVSSPVCSVITSTSFRYVVRPLPKSEDLRVETRSLLQCSLARESVELAYSIASEFHDAASVMLNARPQVCVVEPPSKLL